MLTSPSAVPVDGICLGIDGRHVIIGRPTDRPRAKPFKSSIKIGAVGLCRLSQTPDTQRLEDRLGLGGVPDAVEVLADVGPGPAGFGQGSDATRVPREERGHL